MKSFSRIALVAAALTLAGSAACSKSPAGESPNQNEVASGDVQGLAKETLLVMKFHHDN